ncbi:thermonuclease family protein [Beggiatoa leptomitoformis]|uniref:Nuclease n=1 Tax=Beggiatoa leptomitoformis TaxID=288004 RepID=A0A2N9YFN8_9GAMM|nr:thermonuclease family protein [Beggiatoa leptomitoformis]ALG68323.1 nuclease [Beggiatoa leptomitoformis]AUI69361.1 nuclease [Beggiatoa leptomitoformis]
MKLFNVGYFNQQNILLKLTLLTSCLVFSACQSSAVKSSGTATGISARVFTIESGDTLTLLDSKNKLLTARLAEIDAPENAQALGMAAKQNLFNLTFDKTVQVIIEKTEARQVIARIYVNKTDLSTEQVKKGLAWVLTTSTDKNLQTLEKTARSKKLGLWAAANPIPPWEYRAGKKR